MMTNDTVDSVDTASEAIEAIENGKQIVVTGATSHGKDRFVPGVGDFATWFSPTRRWDAPKRNYEVFEDSMGGLDRDEVRAHIQDYLDHSEISVAIEEYTPEAER